MGQKIIFSGLYYVPVQTTIELPEGKTWGDVTDWELEFNIIKLWFKPRKSNSPDLTINYDKEISVGEIDWNSPVSITAFNENYEELDRYE